MHLRLCTVKNMGNPQLANAVVPVASAVVLMVKIRSLRRKRHKSCGIASANFKFRRKCSSLGKFSERCPSIFL